MDKAQVVINVLTSSTKASPTVAAIRSTMSGFALPAGLSAYLTGQLPSAVDNQNSQAHAQKLTEDLSVLIILVMLIIVFRAVGAPLVTLVPAIWVLLMSGAIIAEASKAGLQVSTITETMLTVLLLGAGTDYGLFFIMRVREEIAGGATPHVAIERAGRYVGESITFSAGTVIVALLTLVLASFGLYSGLGPALALGVALMLLAALTLLPALLGVFGTAVFWPRPVRVAKKEGVYARLADHVIAHPVVTLVVRRGVPGRAGPVRVRVHLQRFRRPDHRAAREPVGQRHQRDQRPLPGRRGQPDPGADGLQIVGLEEPRPGQPGRDRADRQVGVRLGRPARSTPTARR